MLNELAKKDKQWRKKALLICKDRDTADELVQEMYLKLANYDKSINDNFVYLCLENLNKDRLKKKSRILLIESEAEVEQKKDLNYLEIKLIEAARNLKFYELELLDMSGEFSLNELSKRYNIPLSTIQTIVKNAKKQIWQEVENLKHNPEA